MSGWKCSVCGCDLRLKVGPRGQSVLACPREDDYDHFMDRKKRDAAKEWSEHERGGRWLTEEEWPTRRHWR